MVLVFEKSEDNVIDATLILKALLIQLIIN